MITIKCKVLNILWILCDYQAPPQILLQYFCFCRIRQKEKSRYKLFTSSGQFNYFHVLIFQK